MVDKKEDSEDKELADLLEGNLVPDTGTKEAIKTLHPDDRDKQDRLTVLTDNEISAHSSVEWQIKALETKDWTKEFIIKGFTDKIKALKVSKGGIGRGEVTHIFKPQILGDMMTSGMIPPEMVSAVPRKRGFFGNLLGRRKEGW